MIDWENTFILEVETDFNKRLFVESWFINSKSNVILVCIFAKLICEQLQLLNFVAMAISKVNHPLFDIGRISTVSDDELLAVVTVRA